MSAPFEFPARVQLHDVDAAGVMFFAHYYRHAHDAYEAFMQAIGFPLPELIASGALLPLVRSEADHRQPARHGDALTIALGVLRIGDSSFTLEYRFVDHHQRQLAHLRTTHVMLDPVAQRPQGLPEPLRRQLTRYILADADD